VKALPEPVEVFELIGAAPTRTRMQAAAAHGLTQFVGRQTELEALRQALEKARAKLTTMGRPSGEANRMRMGPALCLSTLMAAGADRELSVLQGK
ncbi:MAG: hypothetical protein ACE5JD_15850, partial [Candidatus Methylomirabilia bacterium]